MKLRFDAELQAFTSEPLEGLHGDGQHVGMGFSQFKTTRHSRQQDDGMNLVRIVSTTIWPSGNLMMSSRT